MKVGQILLAHHSIFITLSLMREPKKQFLSEKNGIFLLITSHGKGLATKTWKNLSSVQNKTPQCRVNLLSDFHRPWKPMNFVVLHWVLYVEEQITHYSLTAGHRGDDTPPFIA